MSNKINTQDISDARAKAVCAAKRLFKTMNDHYSDDIYVQIFFLFGARFDWVDNVMYYRDAISSFTIAMTDPTLSSQIVEKMGKETYKDLITMLGRFNNFCEAIREEQYEAGVDVELMDHHESSPTAHYNPVEWFNARSVEFEQKRKLFLARKNPNLIPS